MEPLLKDTSDIRTPCLIKVLEWVPTLNKYILFCPWKKDTSLIMTIIWVPRVSVLKRFHYIYIYILKISNTITYFVHCIHIFKLVVIFRRTFASVDIFLPSSTHQQWQRLHWHLKWAWTGVINFTCPKCIKLPTFFMCDRLSETWFPSQELTLHAS